MLHDSVVVVVVVVVCTRPRVIPLAMITMRKSTHGFPFLSYMSMGLRLAALWAAGAPLLPLIIWLCLTRTGDYQINKFDWLKLIFTVV